MAEGKKLLNYLNILTIWCFLIRCPIWPQTSYKTKDFSVLFYCFEEEIIALDVVIYFLVRANGATHLNHWFYVCKALGVKTPSTWKIITFDAIIWTIFLIFERYIDDECDEIWGISHYSERKWLAIIYLYGSQSPRGVPISEILRASEQGVKNRDNQRLW